MLLMSCTVRNGCLRAFFLTNSRQFENGTEQSDRRTSEDDGGRGCSQLGIRHREAFALMRRCVYPSVATQRWLRDTTADCPSWAPTTESEPVPGPDPRTPTPVKQPLGSGVDRILGQNGEVGSPHWTISQTGSSATPLKSGWAGTSPRELRRRDVRASSCWRVSTEAHAVHHQHHHAPRLRDIPVAGRRRDPHAGEQQLRGVHIGSYRAGSRGGIEEALQRGR